MASSVKKKEDLADMADFIGVLASVRGGKAAIALSQHLGKVVAAVKETNQKGKLMVTLTLSPTSINSEGEVDEIRVDVSDKMTLPSVAPGSALFFPTPKGNGLTQTDPAQTEMFSGGPEVD